MNPTRLIREAAAPYPHIKVEANPSKERMDALIHNAQIHMLITFQDTGLTKAFEQLIRRKAYDCQSSHASG